MMDVTTERDVAFRTHLPTLIVTLLIAAIVLSGLLAGFAMSKRKSRSWAHEVVLASMPALTIYTVLDIDFPRYGLINIESAYQPLLELRRSMR